MKRSPKLFNLPQCDFLLISGCTVDWTGIEFSEKLNKDAVYRIFIADKTYEEAMAKWRNRDR